MIEVLVILAIVFMVYFLPTLLASGKKGFAGVFVINLFLGWTLIGWVVSSEKENK
jgi:hypothetical protein